MIDIKEISGGKLTAEGFKDFVLDFSFDNNFENININSLNTFYFSVN